MRAVPPIALGIAFLAVSVFVTVVASTFALTRAEVGVLDADLASLIRADYSAGSGALAPLDTRIIEVVRQDEQKLRETSPGGEIVPVFVLNRPGAGGSADSADGSGDAVSQPGDPTSTETGTTPTSSPQPGTTPTPTPSPGQTPTPTPTPLPPPPPLPPPIPVPTVPLSGTWALYLHDDPSPPTGDTASEPLLPLDFTPPVARILYNYDIDRDDAAGLVIQRGGTGPGEGDAAKFQAWRTSALPVNVTIQGTVHVDLWSALRGFNPGPGSLSLYLRDFNGSSYTEVTSLSETDFNWQGGNSSWVLKKLAFPVSSYTLLAGHQLELKIIVGQSSSDDMWLAYDTVAYSSVITFQAKV